MKREIRISYADFVQAARDHLAQLYPEMEGAKMQFVIKYPHEGESYFENNPAGDPHEVSFTVEK